MLSIYPHSAAGKNAVYFISISIRRFVARCIGIETGLFTPNIEIGIKSVK